MASCSALEERKLFSLAVFIDKLDGVESETSAVEHVAQAAEPENFAFVMNVGRLTDAASYTLAPGNELRRARADAY
jgi:hypothetical protein